MTPERERQENLSSVSFSSKVAGKSGKVAHRWPTSAEIPTVSGANWPLRKSGQNVRHIVAGMKPCFVYYLADPRTPRHPRYVGSTTNPLERERQHRNHPSAGTAAFARWKRDLRAAGLAPRLVIVARYDDVTAALEAEWRLMFRWRRRGLADLSTDASGNLKAWALSCTRFHNRKWA